MTAVIALVAVGLGFVLCCLVDVTRAREFRSLDRETWALICLVSLPLGGMAYLAVGKKWAIGKKWKARDPGSVPPRPMRRAH